MIKVTVLIGEEGANGAEIISAVSIARVLRPDEEIRVEYPIDPETFFPRPQASGNPRSRTRLARQN